MYFHWHNDKDTARRFGHWLSGRAWLGQSTQLHVEWGIPAFRNFDLSLDLNGREEDAIMVHLGLLLFSLYIGIRNRWLYNLLERITRRQGQKYTNGRNIGIRIEEWIIWVDLWNDPDEWRSVDPKWWHFTIDIPRIIFGKYKYAEVVVETGKVTINMPEGGYEASYEVKERSWKRERWIFTKRRKDVSFELPVGIPHYGKGENSWDCGMDGTYGIGTDWNGNMGEAIKKITMRCLETRQKRGSLNDPAYAKWREEGLERISQKAV